jgi:hypothetical protein
MLPPSSRYDVMHTSQFNLYMQTSELERYVVPKQEFHTPFVSHVSRGLQVENH